MGSNTHPQVGINTAEALGSTVNVILTSAPSAMAQSGMSVVSFPFPMAIYLKMQRPCYVLAPRSGTA